MLVALLGSAVAASLITALFAKAQTDKGAIVDNIIKERKAWRDKLRVLVSCTEGFFNKRDSGGLASIEAQLVVLLNPYDSEDLAIIHALNRIPEKWEKAHLEEFVDRVAYLLKHDWERVKQESGTRISPQTLALASLVVAVVVTTTEWVFGLEASLQIGRDLAFWLAGAFFFIAVTANPPRAPFSYKKILYWIANESFREPYRERNDR
tara:strand:+ start:42438 stop:43061 length:624 start_codon:yes stop_codon:yes gene_type:complete